MKYNDGTEATIPVAYGDDLRDWWNLDRSSPVSRGTVVWEGSNAITRSNNRTLRLYLAKWMNPWPEKQVDTIDFVSTNTMAAPFCVAMTADEPAESTSGPTEAPTPEAKAGPAPKTE